MKGSHAAAKSAHALAAQAETVAELDRKMNLILAHLGLPTSKPDPEADAEIDRRAEEAAGDPKEQKRLEEEARKAAATPQSTIPTRDEDLVAQRTNAPSEAKTKAASKTADDRPVRKR